MSIQRLLLFTSPPKPVTKSTGRKTSSCEDQVPKFSGVENYRKSLEIKGISSGAAKRISMSRLPVQLQVTNWPGTIGLAGVTDNKLIQFVCL